MLDRSTHRESKRSARQRASACARRPGGPGGRRRRRPRAPWPGCRPRWSPAATRRSTRRSVVGRRQRGQVALGVVARVAAGRGCRRRPPRWAACTVEPPTPPPPRRVRAGVPPARRRVVRGGGAPATGRAAPLPAATSSTRSQGRPAVSARWTASMPSSTSSTVNRASGRARVSRSTSPVRSPRTTSADGGGAHAGEAVAGDLGSPWFTGHLSQPRDRSVGVGSRRADDDPVRCAPAGCLRPRRLPGPDRPAPHDQRLRGPPGPADQARAEAAGWRGVGPLRRWRARLRLPRRRQPGAGRDRSRGRRGLRRAAAPPRAHRLDHRRPGARRPRACGPSSPPRGGRPGRPAGASRTWWPTGRP